MSHGFTVPPLDMESLSPTFIQVEIDLIDQIGKHLYQVHLYSIFLGEIISSNLKFRILNYLKDMS